MDIDPKEILKEPISKKQVSDASSAPLKLVENKQKVNMKNWLIELYWGHGDAYEHFNTVCSTS